MVNPPYSAMLGKTWLRSSSVQWDVQDSVERSMIQGLYEREHNGSVNYDFRISFRKPVAQNSLI